MCDFYKAYKEVERCMNKRFLRVLFSKLFHFECFVVEEKPKGSKKLHFLYSIPQEVSVELWYRSETK